MIMANKIKGEVELVHNGKIYIMALDFNALADFEEEAGVESALETLKNPAAMNARTTRILFWCGLRQRHPEVTKLEAGQILSSNMSAMGDALKSAFPDAIPEEDHSKGNAAGPRRPAKARL